MFLKEKQSTAQKHRKMSMLTFCKQQHQQRGRKMIARRIPALSLASVVLLLVTGVHGRLKTGRQRTPSQEQQKQQQQDPRAQAMFRYGDYSSQRKMYTVELSAQPLVVKHPHEYRQGHRHVWEYARYLETQQASLLAEFDDDVEMVTSFQYIFNGVTVLMTDAQADRLRQRSDVMRIWEEGFYDLLDVNHHHPPRTTTTTTMTTTNRNLQVQQPQTPPVVALSHRGKLWANNRGLTGEDIVIGVLDSGIAPENASFDDKPGQGGAHAYGPPPATFTGTGCAFGNQDYNNDDEPFACQGKILAAKCYVRMRSNKMGDEFTCGGDGIRLEHDDHFLSARDDDGHGTHVAATAAGNANVPAVINGETVGITSGVASRARLSIYKVCWDEACGSGDILRALEDAVADGVDVINYSIGGGISRATDVAFLNLLQAGIVPVAAAGNDGPEPETISFPAAYPWMIAVAASGDPHGTSLVLQVSFPVDVEGTYTATTTNGGVPATLDNVRRFNSRLVATEPLEACEALGQDLNGKVALIIRGTCTFEDKIDNARDAGAEAVIIYNDGTAADRMGLVNMRVTGTTIPAIFVAHEAGKSIKESLDVGDSPIVGVTFISDFDSVAAFSSRGSNTGFSTDVIKPDIIAPGMDVLAADSPFVAGVDDVGRNDFGYKDGTSMASPHISGLMALMREAYPDWTPSALKSAMMTTARQDIRKSLLDYDQASPLETGSGFPVINNALDPGLVYDITLDEHRAAYCGIDDEGVGKRECKDLEDEGYSLDLKDLNYPSISVSNFVDSQTLSRTVTNVAPNAAALYFTAALEAAPAFHVTVSPCEFILAPGESLTFEVTLESAGFFLASDWYFGSLTWVGDELNTMPNVRPQDGGTSTCTTKPTTVTQESPSTRERYLRTGIVIGGRAPSNRLQDAEFDFVQDSVARLSPQPSSSPSSVPTSTPTLQPSEAPSVSPTISAFSTMTPSQSPSEAPSASPSQTPTDDPTTPLDQENSENDPPRYKVYSPIAIKVGL